MTRPPAHFVLLGPMGSGKTTVGTVLARRLGRPLIDSDAQIEIAYGKTGRTIAREEGVDRLHELEEAALRQALDHRTPSVIAAAASVGDAAGIERLLDRNDVTVVLLDGDADVLARRARSGAHRRHIDVSRSRGLASRRAAKLGAAVDQRVDVTTATPDEVADQILESPDP